MKRFAIPTLLVAALAMFSAALPAKAQVNVNVTIGGFYDELSPYGRWIDCSYGQCWVPERVSADWQPYTNGQWAYTDYGWTWMSDDPWGGNPYHYGTWASLDRYGWCWIPGTVWAPAWVTWSYGNNYVGWAPLPPTVAFGASGYAGSAVVVSTTQYVFVPMNRFVGTNVTSVRVAARENATIFRQTTAVTRFAVSGGIVRNTAIPVATIERAGGVRIATRNISDARTTPRAMAAGSRQVAIVAPAREVKDAVAARPQAVSRSSESVSPEKSHKSDVSHESRGARPDARQESAVERAPVKPHPQQEKVAPVAHEASPGQSHVQGDQAVSAHRQESSSVPAPAQVRPPEPRREAAPAQAVQPAPPKQSSEHAKPVDKNKDKVKEKDKDNNEEKH